MTLELLTKYKVSTYRWIERFEEFTQGTWTTNVIPTILRRLTYLTKHTSLKILRNKMILGTGTHNSSTQHTIWLDAVPTEGPAELRNSAGLIMLNAPYNAGSHSVLTESEEYVWNKDQAPKFSYRNTHDTHLCLIYLSTNTNARFYYQIEIEMEYSQHEMPDRKSEFAHNYFFEESHDYHCDVEEQDAE